MTIYLSGQVSVDYKPEDANKIGDSFRKAFPFENLPASTWLGVQSLALERLLVEIDAIAVMLENNI